MLKGGEKSTENNTSFRALSLPQNVEHYLNKLELLCYCPSLLIRNNKSHLCKVNFDKISAFKCLLILCVPIFKCLNSSRMAITLSRLSDFHQALCCC